MGPQEPPTAGTASAWGARSAGRGSLLWTTGTTARQPEKGVPIARRYGVPVRRPFTALTTARGSIPSRMSCNTFCARSRALASVSVP
ncbi:hypothetical protein AB433_10585 [Croceicoccus naphthovorans]|uniref:Uncharacterized protein n=1 Tax=Croceicoccus naphthovorans TaxID=1348774 RepID=A0A0G3XIU5_9SPHN|nr:hypothetical protein AB433_10585 [Croceicoccus naphthovorans]